MSHLPLCQYNSNSSNVKTLTTASQSVKSKMTKDRNHHGHHHHRHSQHQHHHFIVKATSYQVSNADSIIMTSITCLNKIGKSKQTQYNQLCKKVRLL